MTITLVVVRPFAGLSRGDTITDPGRIGAVLGSEHAADVVRVLAIPGQPAIPETKES